MGTILYIIGGYIVAGLFFGAVGLVIWTIILAVLWATGRNDDLEEFRP